MTQENFNLTPEEYPLDYVLIVNVTGAPADIITVVIEDGMTLDRIPGTNLWEARGNEPFTGETVSAMAHGFDRASDVVGNHDEYGFAWVDLFLDGIGDVSLTVNNLGMAKPVDQTPVTGLVIMGTILNWYAGAAQDGMEFFGWVRDGHDLVVGEIAPPADDPIWINVAILYPTMPESALTIYAVWGNSDRTIGGRDPEPTEYSLLNVRNLGMTRPDNQLPESGNIPVGTPLPWNAGTAETGMHFLGWVAVGHGLVTGQLAPPEDDPIWLDLGVLYPTMPANPLTVYGVWGDGNRYIGQRDPEPVQYTLLTVSNLGMTRPVNQTPQSGGHPVGSPLTWYPGTASERMEFFGWVAVGHSLQVGGVAPPAGDPIWINPQTLYPVMPEDALTIYAVWGSSDRTIGGQDPVHNQYALLTVRNLGMNRPSGQTPETGTRIVGSSLTWNAGNPITGMHFLGWVAYGHNLQVGQTAPPATDGIWINPSVVHPVMPVTPLTIYAVWGDSQGNIGGQDCLGNPCPGVDCDICFDCDNVQPCDECGYCPDCCVCDEYEQVETPEPERGPEGEQGPAGERGPAGPAGSAGATGATGAAGADKRPVPKTGDEANMNLWMLFFALGLVGFTGASTVLVNNKKEQVRRTTIIIEDDKKRKCHLQMMR
jgi:hypothetical protein